MNKYCTVAMFMCIGTLKWACTVDYFVGVGEDETVQRWAASCMSQLHSGLAQTDHLRSDVTGCSSCSGKLVSPGIHSDLCCSGLPCARLTDLVDILLLQYLGQCVCLAVCVCYFLRMRNREAVILYLSIHSVCLCILFIFNRIEDHPEVWLPQHWVVSTNVKVTLWVQSPLLDVYITVSSLLAMMGWLAGEYCLVLRSSLLDVISETHRLWHPAGVHFFFIFSLSILPRKYIEVLWFCVVCIVCR